MSGPRPSPRRARGIGLVELMVAATVGLILLAGVMAVFLSNKRTYEVTDDLSRLQENARFALDTMLRDLRGAGYVGCGSDLDAVENVAFDPDTQTRGEPSDLGVPSGSGLPAGPGIEGIDELTDQITPPGGFSLQGGSDSVVVRYLAGPGLPLAADSTDTQLTVSGALDVEAGELAAVADCASAVVFEVSAVTSSGGNRVVTSSNTLPRVYPQTPTNQVFPNVAAVRTARYYVALDGAGVPALHRQTATEDEHLVDGIEHMEVLYGIDTTADGRPDSYVAAGTANLDSSDEWRQVVSVRLGLLARTVDQYGAAADTRAYDLFTGEAHDNPADCTGPGCVDPADAPVRRRVFTTTAFVRNRS